MTGLRTLMAILGLAIAASSPAVAGGQEVVDWPVTGGDPGGIRYSPLRDIDRTNVGRLKVAWTYRHGDFRDGGPFGDYVAKGTAFEATPIVVEKRLVFSTPFDRVIALDPETGKELWSHDPAIDKNRRFANMMISRGVAYWRDRQASGVCAARIFFGTLDARLIALDLESGKQCADFGVAGAVDLRGGLRARLGTTNSAAPCSPSSLAGGRGHARRGANAAGRYEA
jgi:quinoprotein glucose dehydrogenase